MMNDSKNIDSDIGSNIDSNNLDLGDMINTFKKVADNPLLSIYLRGL